MLESQKRHNNHIMAESKAGELMALHSSFWLPLAFATLFLIFDMYHVCEHMDCGEKTTCDVVSAYGFALFHSFNSYFPSTLLPFAIFVVLQQGIYHVYAGVDQWKLGRLMFWAVAYSALYAVYIVEGDASVWLTFVMAVATIVFWFSVWLSLRENVRKAPAAWRRALGKS